MSVGSPHSTDPSKFGEIPIVQYRNLIQDSALVRASVYGGFAGLVAHIGESFASSPKWKTFSFRNQFFVAGNVFAFTLGRYGTQSESTHWLMSDLIGASMAGAYSAVWARKPSYAFWSFITWATIMPLSRALTKAGENYSIEKNYMKEPKDRDLVNAFYGLRVGQPQPERTLFAPTTEIRK
eukprot:TRINITY_DN1344_c0_g1_i4.p1 TRINITY_DN1344_c0_g1~~TRINITY_DN1344_c0_g1_i4.p1  ORF type:complete len:207 (+),score=14.71 TRINITY_DN1344_c0_g1_i4:81-623(+)